jgi:hypothetical protein
MNQDRIIDKINQGDVSLSEAQDIYDYCLALLEKQNRLNEVRNTNDVYFHSELNYDYEIKSFFPSLSDSFNEFKITDKREGNNYKVSILLDTGADGKLDELLKGGILVKDAQVHYDKVISKGLSAKKLRKIKNSVVVE